MVTWPHHFGHSNTGHHDEEFTVEQSLPHEGSETNENAPHRLIYLYVQFTVGGTVWEGLRGVALLYH